MTPLPPPAIVSIAHRRRGQKAFSAREPFFSSLAAIVRRIVAAFSFSAWAENVTEKVVPTPQAGTQVRRQKVALSGGAISQRARR
jgi:hypothetical protein